MEWKTVRIWGLVKQIEKEGRIAFKRASKREREEAMQIATAEIDRLFEFKGHKASPTQALSWPRRGVTDKKRQAVTGVPRAVSDAASFLAGAHLAGYQIGVKRDHSIALVMKLNLMLKGLLDPANPMRPDIRMQ
jgi:hypothetical protein